MICKIVHCKTNEFLCTLCTAQLQPWLNWPFMLPSTELECECHRTTVGEMNWSPYHWIVDFLSFMMTCVWGFSKNDFIVAHTCPKHKHKTSILRLHLLCSGRRHCHHYYRHQQVNNLIDMENSSQSICMINLDVLNCSLSFTHTAILYVHVRATSHTLSVIQ